MDYKKFNTCYQNASNHAAWSRFVFWAFSKEQFKEGCQKVHAKQDKRGEWQLTSIPGGGFLTLKGIPTWLAFWANWKRYEKKIKMGEKETIDGLVYEYRNHEAQFGMGGKEEAEKNFPNATPRQKTKAWTKFMKLCQENDWF